MSYAVLDSDSRHPIELPHSLRHTRAMCAAVLARPRDGLRQRSA